MARGARGKEASKRHKEQRERDPAVLKRRAAFVHREVHEAQEELFECCGAPLRLLACSRSVAGLTTVTFSRHSPSSFWAQHNGRNPMCRRQLDR
jgi:hypothetical protein